MILKELALKLGLDLDSASFAEGAGAVEGIKAGLEAVVEGAKKVAETFVEAIKSTAEYGDQVIELAAATGVGTASLQHLAAAAVEDGIGLEELSHSLILLTRQMSSAKGGSEETVKAFKDLGVKVTDVNGKLRPTEDVLIDISDKFSKMKDGGEKTAASLKLFGRSGAGLIDFLNKGRDAFEEFFQEAVPSDEELQAGKRVVEIQRLLVFQTQQLVRGAIAQLLPAIRDLLQEYYNWKKANAEVLKQNIAAFVGLGIRAIKGLRDVLLIGIDTIRAFKDGLRFLSENMSEFNDIVRLVTAGLGAYAIAAALTATINPFGALFAGFTALAVIFQDLAEYTKSVEHGGHGLNTAFGKFNRDIAAWSAANKGNEPWWLTALKDAQSILELIRQQLIEIGWLKKQEQVGSQLPGEATTTGLSGRKARNVRGIVYSEDELNEIKADPYGDKAKLFRARQQALTEGYGSNTSLLAALLGLGTTGDAADYTGDGAFGRWAQPAQPYLNFQPANGGPGANTTIGSLSFTINGGDPNEVRRVIGEELTSRGVVDASALESTVASASYNQP